MCGLVGILALNSSIHTEHINAMLDIINHRGPDDFGIWFDDKKQIALGHKRLSILDLSALGHQPMHSHCGRYVISYNGEIYNFLAIRKDLEKIGVEFISHSDTEVILAAIAHYGIEATLKKINGMFAFAVWDKELKKLYLARDRLGEKPLYYSLINNEYIFASELKSFQVYPGFNAEIDRDNLGLYLKYNYVPAPYSIYRNVFKLKPGSYLTIDLNSKDLPTPRDYWSVTEVVQQRRTTGSDNDIIQQAHELLLSSIKSRMVSDVPLGVFLSGGIDSSLITALMQANSNIPVKSFTIGFNEADYNEAEYAKKVAAHLGTDHTELYINSSDALDVIPKLPFIYDEPFADSSQIPTYLVSKLTREHVTVCLSGDGGDELFGGYNRYLLSHKLWQKIKLIPQPLRSLIAKSITTISPSGWDKAPELIKKFLGANSALGDKLHKLASVLNVKQASEIYQLLISQWNETSSLVLGAKPITMDCKISSSLTNFTEQMMCHDMLHYLPDDILVKVDRASMAVSLESRAPFLDHEIVEFAWRLPLNMKIRDKKTKWLLREILYQYIPRELIERPKMGFGVPIDSWLRGPLRDWAENLLAQKRLEEEGYFIPKLIRAKWEEHLSGKRNWQYHIWTILMFQAWLDQQKRNSSEIMYAKKEIVICN